MQFIEVKIATVDGVDKLILVEPTDYEIFVKRNRKIKIKITGNNKKEIKVELKKEDENLTQCQWVKNDHKSNKPFVVLLKTPKNEGSDCSYNIIAIVPIGNDLVLDPRIVVDPPSIINSLPGVVEIDAKPGIEPPFFPTMLPVGAMAIFILTLVTGYLVGKMRR